MRKLVYGTIPSEQARLFDTQFPDLACVRQAGSMIVVGAKGVAFKNLFSIHM